MSRLAFGPDRFPEAEPGTREEGGQDGLCRSRRGSALLFALFALMTLSIVGMALASNTTQSLHLVRLQTHASMAFNLAESGAEDALLWLRVQPFPPAGAAAFDPFGGPVALGDGTYQVTIDPDNDNANIELKRYLIRSTGVAISRQETVQLYVQLGTFGRYAYFTDYETSPTGQRIFFRAGNIVDGPAHSNNSGGSDFQVSWVGATDPIFRDQLTSVANEIDYTPGNPSTEEEFRRIYQSGSRGYRLGVSRIELPESTDLQKIAAWGADFGFPGSTGVHVPSAGSSAVGGIYIVGDSSLNFTVTPEGWQRIAITQGSTTTTITIKRNQNQTLVQRGSTTTTYTGTTNGVIYSTGHITGLRGQIADSQMSGSTLVSRNAFTIATDVRNNKDVTVTNNLSYRTPPDRSRPWDDPVNLRSPALGVVARNITLSSSAPTNLTLHGVMLAGGRNTTGGSFSATNYDSRSPGALTLVGGVIQKYRGPVGTFSGSTSVSGYLKNYIYDPRMAVMPPPFFPTTGTYERLSFMRTDAGPAAH
jgi:hypothetical protein